jgi:ubiquinone biosynthesis protein
LLREYHLALPPDLTLLIKSLITLEGMGRQLDPEFDMVTEFSPFLHQALRARYAPDALVKRGWQAVVGGLDILTELPKDLHHLLRSARSGRLQVHVDVTRLKNFGNQLDRATSRLTMGVVIAALIIGSSIVMTVDHGPVLFGLPLFGMLGFLGAAAVGVWLLISIRRSGKNLE